MGLKLVFDLKNEALKTIYRASHRPVDNGTQNVCPICQKVVAKYYMSHMWRNHKIKFDDDAILDQTVDDPPNTKRLSIFNTMAELPTDYRLEQSDGLFWCKSELKNILENDKYFKFF